MGHCQTSDFDHKFATVAGPLNLRVFKNESHYETFCVDKFVTPWACKGQWFLALSNGTGAALEGRGNQLTKEITDDGSNKSKIR